MESISDYIAFRYNNWLDFANHLSITHHFESWGEDLLNDVIVDLLLKPHEKLNEMLSRKTTLLVNHVPTNELDKFVLKMLRSNATYATAPFRKNTLGLKIIDRQNKKIDTVKKTQLKQVEIEDCERDIDHDEFIDLCHEVNKKRLRINGFNQQAIEIYIEFYQKNTLISSFNDAEKKTLSRITDFLVQKRKTLADENQ